MPNHDPIDPRYAFLPGRFAKFTATRRDVRVAVPTAVAACMILVLVAGNVLADAYDAARNNLLEKIQRNAADTGGLTGRRGFSPETMAALRRVPRHEFVRKEHLSLAYANRPLPIGYGQTISQPYIVALMTDLLDLSRDQRLLEVGTGSGYQAAVAAEVAGHVYTVEIIGALADQARDRLKDLGVANVTVHRADGYHGWPRHAPFDAIIVTAAADHIPPPLVRQLRPGGRMVIPVGPRFLTQQLVLIEKAHDGRVTARQLLPVRFVPLTRKP